MILIEAILRDSNQIEVSIHKHYLSSGSKYFYLFENGKFVKELKIDRINETNNHFRYMLTDLYPFVIGNEYEILDDHNTLTPVDLSILMKNFEIDKKFFSDEEMGASYSRNFTIFRVFSPLASEISVLLFHENHKETYYMSRNSNGVYYYKAFGDYEGYEYLYLVKINGKYIETIDPYALSTTVLSRRGVIINKNHFKIDFNDDKLKNINPTEAVIYELNVRDFTSSINTSIKNKGKFLGITEENCKSLLNNPVGLDYLKYLGISHVQLLPVTDFLSTNDLFPEHTYNWGYDPGYYFALEGSYSTKPDKPYSRIYEMKMLVSTLHANNIRVILDVVFNHLFTFENSCFQKILPNYYFRFNSDGTLSNGSFCGNEFESLRPMARKFIVDCCLYYVKEFHVDGFRFDLMGLTDIDTINEVYEKCKKLNPSFMLYGEGWDMPSALDNEKKTKIANAYKVPNIGFFNDRYRDMVKGKSSDHELSLRGYLLGDLNYADIFRHCFLASSLSICMPPYFSNPSQSVNYIECHDNATLYDKLLISNSYENEQQRLKRINLLNAGLIFSYGICFIHSGQEIGLSKNGVYNSYNSGDAINQFNVDVLDKRFNMAKFVKEAIELKKSLPCFNLALKDDLEKNVQTEIVFGRVIVTIYNARPYEKIKIIFNPTNEIFTYQLDSYYQVLFNEYGKIDKDFYVQNVIVNDISMMIMAKKYN